MTTNPEKLYQDCLKAWNNHEVEKTLSYYTDDAVYEDIPMAKVARGRVEMKALLIEMFAAFPDLKFEAKPFLLSGDRAAFEWLMTGTFSGGLKSAGLKPTGKSFSVRGVTMGELRSEKIRRETDYYDGVTFLRQIGLMP